MASSSSNSLQLTVEDDSEESYIEEILEILMRLSNTYNLHLAQAWAPSDQCNAADAYRRSGGNTVEQVSMSVETVAFYIRNRDVLDFREACEVHQLLKGQGVVGKSFLTLNPCFCGDITEFRKSEYPLEHYARLFGLRSCFAIPLHDPTMTNIYVLELFLPHPLEDPTSRNNLMDSLLGTVKQFLGSLRISFANGPEEERYIDVIDFLESIPTYQTNKVRIGHIESLQNEEEMEKTGAVDQHSLKFDHVFERRTINDTRGENPSAILNKPRERMTLDDLQRFGELPLNDAAERLGVSRSTLKRLCRRHGILRWPSHKKKRCNSEQNIENFNRSVEEPSEGVAVHSSLSRGGYINILKNSLNVNIPNAPQYVQRETPVEGNTIEKMDTSYNIITSLQQREKDIVSCQPRDQVVESFTPTIPTIHVAATQDARKLTIKARYMDDIIKFSLSSSSGVAELQKEVLKRLKLKLGTFTIKYLDTDQDWILIACDDDLQDCMQACLSAGSSSVQMSIQTM